MQRLTRPPGGNALVTVLVVLGAFMAGAAGVAVPRLWHVDVLERFAPAEPKAESAVAVHEPVIRKDKSAELEKQLRDMIADVSKQRSALDERETATARREKGLTERMESIERLKKELDAAEQRLKLERVDIQGAEVQNLKRLAKIWAEMEAKDVAVLIKGLDNLDTAAKVLACMQARQAAPIFSALAAPEFEKIGAQVLQKLRQIREAAAKQEAS